MISTGHNHHRTHYDGNDVKRKPVSMHAEMHAIFNACVGVFLSFAQKGDSSEPLNFPQIYIYFIPVDSRLIPLPQGSGPSFSQQFVQGDTANQEQGEQGGQQGDQRRSFALHVAESRFKAGPGQADAGTRKALPTTAITTLPVKPKPKPKGGEYGDQLSVPVSRRPTRGGTILTSTWRLEPCEGPEDKEDDSAHEQCKPSSRSGSSGSWVQARVEW